MRIGTNPFAGSGIPQVILFHYQIQGHLCGPGSVGRTIDFVVDPGQLGQTFPVICFTQFHRSFQRAGGTEKVSPRLQNISEVELIFNR